jgi:hypothetical protein
MNQSLTYTLTAAHLATFQKAAMTRMQKRMFTQGRSARLAFWIFIALVIAGGTILVTEVIGRPLDDISALTGFVLAVLMLVAVVIRQRAAVRRNLWREGGPTLADHVTTVDATGLHFVTANFESICRWAAVLDATVYNDLVIVWIEFFNGFVIPRSTFANPQAEAEFLAFARDQLAPPAAPRPTAV